MRIAVGSDHRGYAIRSKVIDLLGRLGHEVVDVGTDSGEPVDYPDIAAVVAHKVSRHEVERGILVCGTGLGMTIVANRFPGVRATLAYDESTARLGRQHNDANVLTLGGRSTPHELALRLVEVWLGTPFEGGRHADRIEKIDAVKS